MNLKNKIIKYATITICVLFLIFLILVIFAKNNTTPSADNIDTETSSGSISQTDSSTSDDENENQDNDETDTSQPGSNDNNKDNEQETGNTGQTNSSQPEEPDDNDGKPLNPDSTVIGWDEIKYPKERMQKIIDQIARANAILEKKTGENVFTMKTQDISTKGMVVYVSEYGKNNLFSQKIQNIGGRDMVSYPDEVIFGFAMFLGGNFKPEEMNEWEQDHDVWRDKLTKATTYCYPEEEPVVIDTFDFISCKDSRTSIEMTVAGKGQFAGSNYILKLHQEFDGLWAVLSLTKI